MKYEEYAGDGVRQAKSSAEIQSDVDTIRAEMAETLRQLEQKLSSRELRRMVVNQLRKLRGESTRMVKNVGTTIRAKPLVPSLVLATSLGALLLTLRARRMRAARHRSLAEQMREALAEIRGEAGNSVPAEEELMKQARERMHSTAKRAAPRLEEFLDEARARAMALREKAALAASKAAAGFSGTRRHARRIAEDRPLLLVGLGLLGAAAAAGTLALNERKHHSFHRAINRLKQIFAPKSGEPSVRAEPHTGAEPGLEIGEDYEQHFYSS